MIGFHHLEPAWDNLQDGTDAETGGYWAVQLIDRRTGQVHRRNGSPVAIVSAEPQRAAAELLKGRDPALWQARIDPLPGSWS